MGVRSTTGSGPQTRGVSVGPATRGAADGYPTCTFPVKNTGADAWRKDTGLLSIWVLGMLNASDRSTVVIPFVPGPESERVHIW